MPSKIENKRRLTCAVLVALAGLLVAGNIMLRDPLSVQGYGLLRCAFVGAFGAGLLFAACFGRLGQRGWVWAIAGFMGASVVGALLGVAVMPLDTLLFGTPRGAMVVSNPHLTLFGPMYVSSFVVGHVNVAAAWVIGLAGVHLTARHLTCP